MDGEAPGARLHYLDWLRAIAVFGVFVYHCLQPFSDEDWHVKNDQLTDAASIPVAFFGSWGIGFFFLIAGASAFFALGRRSAGRYVKERITRLLLPLAAGYLLLAPLQSYLEETHFGRYEGSFVSFLPVFFRQLGEEIRGIGPSSDPLLIGHMYHLWFLVFLFWFSLLALPLFLWLRGGGRGMIEALADRAYHRGWTLLFALPLAAVTAAVYAAASDEHDWGEFVYYLWFFVLGFVLLADRRLADAIRRDVGPAVMLGAIGGAILVAGGGPAFVTEWGDAPGYSFTYLWVFSLVAIQAWAWATAALGLGMRAPAFQRPLPASVAEGAMPFFLVHQPVIVAVSFVVVGWDTGILPKFLAVLLVSFVISAAIAWGLSRIRGVSTLFGVKHRRAGAKAEAVRAASLG